MKSPLLVLTACFALGIVAVRSETASWLGIAFTLTAGGACLLAGLLALRGGWQRVSALFALAGFMAVGAGTSFLFQFRFPPNHVSRKALLGVDLADPVRLEGQLISEPLRTAYGLQFDVEVRRLESRRRSHVVSGKVRLRLQAPGDSESLSVAESLQLSYGDSIRTLVVLRKPRVYQNPGSFDFRRWMESVQDVTWVGTIKHPLLVEKLPEHNVPRIGKVLQKTRLRLLEAIDILYPPWAAEGRYGSVLKATLLGDRSSLDSQTIEDFRRSGLYHLLVISGLHVGLLALLAAVLLRQFPLNEFMRSALVLLFLLGYTLLIEQRAATLRATLMIFVYLLARFLYRERSALNAIGIAGLILLVQRPVWLFESGFQLSFSAVLLIAGLAFPVLERTTEPYRRALRQLGDKDRDVGLPPRAAQFRIDLRSLVGSLSGRLTLFSRHPAIAAFLVTGPVSVVLWATNVLLFSAIIQLGLLLPMAETFHRVTFAGIGLNALATPLFTLLLAVGVPTVILAVILPALALWPAKLLAMVTGGFLALTDLHGMPAWLSYRVPEPPVWVSCVFVLSIVTAGLTLGRVRRVFQVSMVTAGIFVILISLHPFAPRLPRGALEVTALDCGDGDAIFVVLPDQTTMLFDVGGGRSGSGREGTFRGRRWDAGEDAVSPYLWSRGVKKIDVVALSDTHRGHAGGLASVLGNFRVGECWHGSNAPEPGYEAWLEEVWWRDIPDRKLVAGDVIPLGGADIRVLWPPAAQRTSPRPSDDDSVVILITAGKASVLLAGAIKSRTQQEIFASGDAVGSLALIAVQQGAEQSFLPELLARTSPHVA
ncbi:MAG: ComEC/Rec2 family competence protein, partial [Acidobacteria bacterium]|nr:ComEC/Rec2 family competence protein [Acidobacteriota bacterium]